MSASGGEQRGYTNLEMYLAYLAKDFELMLHAARIAAHGVLIVSAEHGESDIACA